jgi:hypothetical protein
MSEFRMYTADEILAIIDRLVEMEELSDGDARAMTRLGLILKHFERLPDTNITQNLGECYDLIKDMEIALSYQAMKPSLS